MTDTSPVKWRRRVFQVALWDRTPSTVFGLSCDVFGIHRTATGACRLTHLATGCRFDNEFRTVAAAKRFAAALIGATGEEFWRKGRFAKPYGKRSKWYQEFSAAGTAVAAEVR